MYRWGMFSTLSYGHLQAYGTLPIVHATGGLSDSVDAANLQHMSPEFHELTAASPLSGSVCSEQVQNYYTDPTTATGFHVSPALVAIRLVRRAALAVMRRPDGIAKDSLIACLFEQVLVTRDSKLHLAWFLRCAWSRSVLQEAAKAGRLWSAMAACRSYYSFGLMLPQGQNVGYPRVQGRMMLACISQE
eukprot:4645441-Amphidinium_carterae.1